MPASTCCACRATVRDVRRSGAAPCRQRSESPRGGGHRVLGADVALPCLPRGEALNESISAVSSPLLALRTETNRNALYRLRVSRRGGLPPGVVGPLRNTR